MLVRAGSSAFGLVAAVLLAAAPLQAEDTVAAVVPTAPGIPVLTYETWKHTSTPPIYSADPFFGIEPYEFGPRGYFGLWDHDLRLDVRTAEVAAWWASLPAGYVPNAHPRYFAFLSPDMPERPGFPTYRSAYVDYERGFLEEAMAGGDTIVEVPVRGWDGSPVPVYAVFAAGTPPERVLMVLAWHLRQSLTFGYTEEEIEAFIAETARARGLRADAADLTRYLSGSPRDPPEPSYEEWVHGVPFAVWWYRGSFVWPHDTPLAERLGRSIAAWREPAAYASAGSEQRFPGTFIDLGDGDAHDGFEGRWIAEAIGAGDVVVPFSPPPVATRGIVAARPISFAVFWLGSPPDAVEAVLRTWLTSRYGMTATAIDGVVATYRASIGSAP
jgi:hypothetical protein